MKSEKPSIEPNFAKSETLLQQLAQTPGRLFGKGFGQQYGALCFRFRKDGSEIEILVLTSRGSRRWVIPKRWSMKGKKPYQAAAIEAWEEAGVRGRVKPKLRHLAITRSAMSLRFVIYVPFTFLCVPLAQVRRPQQRHAM